jgi:hypothetical protein
MFCESATALAWNALFWGCASFGMYVRISDALAEWRS